MNELLVDSGMHWYPLKVFYNRVSVAENYLRQQNVQTFVPMRCVESVVCGKKRVKKEPAVSSLLFVRHSEQFVLELQNSMKSRCPFMLYFDRETRRPTFIYDQEMNAFILVTSVECPDLEYTGDMDGFYKLGNKVRVIDGVFKGVEGFITQIRGRRRLVVSIEGVVAAITAHIPNNFLEKTGD